MALHRLMAEQLIMTARLVSLLAIFALLYLKRAEENRACFEK